MTMTSGTITQPIPDTTFYRPMRAGHYVRHGHELAGHLASDDGGQLWRMVLECCQVHPYPVDIAPEARFAVGTYQCDCVPGRLCRPCENRGYRNALAGYAARIHPVPVTAGDVARDARAHWIDPAAEDGISPYDTCPNCGQPVIERRGELVTMLTGNQECYGNTYRPGR